MINEAVLSNSEIIMYSLRDLYTNSGYSLFRMGKFEEYDFYARNKDFLVSDNVITFTDTNGKLMALKPDVTLSIIKNSRDIENIKKVFYNENVYRVSKGTDCFKEIMQTGVECFGDVKLSDIAEVIILAAKSLKLFSVNSVIAISNISIVEKIVDKLDVAAEDKNAVYKAIGDKNLNEINQLCKDNDAKKLLISLLNISGSIIDTKDKVLSLIKDVDAALFEEFKKVLDIVAENDVSKFINLDFSIVGDLNYYNGILFKGFINGIPEAVLSGGQYDKLMTKLEKKYKAIGFAVYTDSLENLDILKTPLETAEKDEYINIALPKGRLGEKAYGIFEKIGYESPSVLEPNRKLIFENTEKKVRYFWVKPSDVAIYVDRGAADIGICGKDILLEYEPNVYELADLKMGKCRMCVAAPVDYVYNPNKTLKVATKFVNIAKRYYQSQGKDIDIIKLNGSIEIAPILGLSDVIVDIVETGSTLKENNLEVKETIVPISARLVANKSSFKFKDAAISRMLVELNKYMENDND